MKRCFGRGLSTRVKWDVAILAASVVYIGAMLVWDLSAPLLSILLAGATAYEWLAGRSN